MDENSENRNADDEVYESVAAKRLSHLHTPAEETPPPPPGGGKRNFFSNLWYHYKFAILTVLFLAVVVPICVVQCATRTGADLHILYAGPWFDCDKATPAAAVEDAFRQLMKDYNEDGEKRVSYKPLFLMTSEQLEALREEYKGGEDEAPFVNGNLIQQNKSLYDSELMSGETVICFLDPAWYADMREAGFLEKLSEYVKDLPANEYDDYAFPLHETEFGNFFAGIKDMPADTLICIRRTGVLTNAWNASESKKNHAYHEDFLQRIFAFHA